jgi:hypothetical protein
MSIEIKKHHILENQNDKHTHCFLIHLNFIKLKLKYQKHANLLKDKGFFLTVYAFKYDLDWILYL